MSGSKLNFYKLFLLHLSIFIGYTMIVWYKEITNRFPNPIRMGLLLVIFITIHIIIILLYSLAIFYNNKTYLLRMTLLYHLGALVCVIIITSVFYSLIGHSWLSFLKDWYHNSYPVLQSTLT